MKGIVVAIAFLISTVALVAQDIHFTQWMHAPHTYSPASVGDFNGEYRFHGNYRNQWSSVTVPFVTFASMAEIKSLTSKIDGLSGSVGLVYDVTGDSRFSTTQISFGSGYSIPFLPDSIGKIRIGVLPTITQKKIDLDALKFDNQYNGFFYDGSLSSGEALPRLSRWYFDVAIGADYQLKVSENLLLRTSIAGFNMLSPNQSFFNNNDIKLDRRLSWQVSGEYSLTDKWNLQPGIQLSKQGQYYSINFGALATLDMSTTPFLHQTIFAGLYFRAVDSGDLIVGLEYDRLKAAVSYDINYSGLVPASNYRGGLELAVIYTIFKPLERPKYKVCPDY